MTDIEKKKAHALAVITKLAEVGAAVEEHEPGLWFGGYPPLYVQIQNFTSHIETQLRTVFEVPLPEEGTE